MTYKKGFAILPKIINSKFVWLKEYYQDELGNVFLEKDSYASKIRSKKAGYDRATGGRKAK